MDKRPPRNIFVNVTPTQKKFLYPVLVLCLLGCTITLLFLNFLYFDQTSAIHDPQFYKLKIIVLIGCIVFSLAMFLIAFAMYFISSKIIGPYERIVDRLDEVIKGEAKGSLHVREKDKLFKGLVDRINTLIERTS